MSINEQSKKSKRSEKGNHTSVPIKPPISDAVWLECLRSPLFLFLLPRLSLSPSVSLYVYLSACPPASLLVFAAAAFAHLAASDSSPFGALCRPVPPRTPGHPKEYQRLLSTNTPVVQTYLVRSCSSVLGALSKDRFSSATSSVSWPSHSGIVPSTPLCPRKAVPYLVSREEDKG